jgi:uncharacterized protein YjbI with pentapeptide repeats
LTCWQISDVNLNRATIRNANLSGVEISDYQLASATINGIAIKELLGIYQQVKGTDS